MSSQDRAPHAGAQDAPAAASTPQQLLRLQEPPPVDLWLSDPLRAHSQWRASLIVANRGYAAHSNRLYGALFGRFVQWVLGQGRNLATVDAAHIDRFLRTLDGRDGRGASVRGRRTYLSEIGRVMDHLRAAAVRRDNPAEELIAWARLREPLAVRNIRLSGAQDLAAQVGPMLSERVQAEDVHPRQVRAAALVALMLDAGLTLKEVQKLTVGRCVLAGQGESARLWVKAPGHRTMPSRDLALSAWASQVVQAWLRHRVQQQQERSRVALTEQEVLALRVFAHPNKRLALRDMTIQRDVKGLLEPLGVAGANPALLRTEFIARLLREGLDAALVAQRAGLRDLAQVSYMREAALQGAMPVRVATTSS